MKRIYRNNDLVFNLTVNGFPFKPELIEKVEFRFYTLNKENYIKKTEADIKDSAITLEWIDLGTLEEGVLYYSYNLSVFTEDLSDKYQNTTDNIMTNYFLLTGKSEIDIEQTKSQWGLIEGDITNQRDLVDYIDLELTTKQDTLVSGNNIKTINGESIVGSGDLVIEGGGSVDLTDYYKKSETYSKQQIDDKGYLTEHQDISGKLDTSVYNNDKSTFALKTELPTKVSQLENDSKYLIEQDISGKVDNETYTAEKKEFLTLVDKKADKTELSDMATKTWVGNEKFLKSVPEEYITETELTQKNYATKSELGSKLDTTTYTEDKKTLAEELKSKLDTAVYNQEKSNFATKDDLGKKQETLVGTETVGQNLKTINGETLLGTGNITISGGSQGGAVDSVNGKTGTVVITAEDLGALTSIPEEYVTDTELTQKGYLTEHQDISGKLDTSVYEKEKALLATKEELKSKLDSSVYTEDKSTFATKSDLTSKLDTSTYNSDKSTFALKSEIPSTDNLATKEELGKKQDILVSGTSIKKVNGEDLLGSGNIEIKSGVGKVDSASSGTGEIFNSYDGEFKNIASGKESHAEGGFNKALGLQSHAEGHATEAHSYQSHSEGNNTRAIGDISHSEGDSTKALGRISHAEGYKTEAKGRYSHAGGIGTVAQNQTQTVIGAYSVLENPEKVNEDGKGPTNYCIFKIGGGLEDTERRDTLKVLRTGTTWISGVGTFDGTNPSDLNSLQAVLKNKVEKTDLVIYAKKSELEDKLDTSVYTKDKSTFALKSELTPLATKEELKGKLDTSTYNNDKSTFATKSDLTSKLDTSTYNEEKALLATKEELKEKLDTSTYNSDKLTFATKSDLTLKADKSELSKYITNETLESKGYITSIPEEYVTDTELNQKGYLTEHQDISGKLDTSVYNEDKKTFALKTELPDTSNLATKEELGEKLDTSTYNQDKPTFALKSEIPSTDNFATKDDLLGKQDTLVSGSTIKTINGEDILGSGNIVIEGGGGSDNGVGKKDPDVWDGSGEIFNDYLNNHATGQYSHAEGNGTRATNNYSHAEGQGSGAEGEGSHAEGTVTTALGGSSHSEGYLTSANGLASHAEGGNNTAYNACEHVQGNYCTEETDKYSEFNPAGSIFKIGNGTETGGRSDALRMLGNGKTWIAGVGDFTGTNPTETNTLQSVLNGKQDTLVGTAVEGQNIKTINGETLLGTGDIKVEGGSGGGGVGEVGKGFGSTKFNLTKSNPSYPKYNPNEANGVFSNASGGNAKANGDFSFVHGSGFSTGKNSYSIATGGGDVVFGLGNKTTYDYQISNSFIAGGDGNTINSDNAFCTGYQNTVSKRYGFSLGSHNTVNSIDGFAAGDNNTASNYLQTVLGRYNTTSVYDKPTEYNASSIIFSIGNGTYQKKSDALKLAGNGTLWIQGPINQNSADYAEMFEWLDKNPNNEDRVGYFVTLKEEKIVKASSTDNYILGIVSATPAFIGDNPNLWYGQYENDEWGRPIYEDVEVTYKEHEINEAGELVEVEKTRIDHIRKTNPNWEASREYIDRTNRPEWDAVGLVGKLLVRQDGTLTPGSFCKSNDSGIATKSESGYYVMKVIDKEQALVMFK